jgi:hypothetical protein
MALQKTRVVAGALAAAHAFGQKTRPSSHVKASPVPAASITPVGWTATVHTVPLQEKVAPTTQIVLRALTPARIPQILPALGAQAAKNALMLPMMETACAILKTSVMAVCIMG